MFCFLNHAGVHHQSPVEDWWPNRTARRNRLLSPMTRCFFWVGNHFGCGESWLYRSQAGNHEYDEGGRLTKPTRGNGRGPVRK